MKLAVGCWSAVVAGILTACGGTEGNVELQKEAPAGEELSASCAGIMPALAPSSWSHRYTLADFTDCGVNTSDGSGNVILETTRPSPVPGSELHNWDIFTSVGHLRGTVQQNDPHIFPQAWGFQSLGSNACGGSASCQPDFGLRAWTANGQLVRSTTPSFHVFVFESALDPTGGVLVVGSRQAKGVEIVAQRFDAHSNPLSPPAVVASGGAAQPVFAFGAVSVSGLTLVVWNGGFSGFPEGSLVGRWLDRFGHALTGPFLVARSGPGDVPLTPLVDGSMAIRGLTGNPASPRGNAFVGILRGGSTMVSAVPSWLATRPDARVSIVRGGRAYALIFPNDQSTCAPAHVALFAPAGNRCGGFDLDLGEPGVSCVRDSNIGRDGTLIATGLTGLPVGRECKDRVFPGLLK